MSKSSFKKAQKAQIKQAQNQRIGDNIDRGIGIGLSLAAVTLNEAFGFGRERGLRFLKAVLTKINKEFKQGANPLTVDYEYSVEQGYYHLNKELGILIGEENLKELERLGFYYENND